MTFFLALNGMGMVFLLYVLANFWKEGHGGGNRGQRYTRNFGEWDKSCVAIVAQPISRAPQRGLSVIPFPSRSRELLGAQCGNAGGSEATDAPVGRVSAR